MILDQVNAVAGQHVALLVDRVHDAERDGRVVEADRGAAVGQAVLREVECAGRVARMAAGLQHVQQRFDAERIGIDIDRVQHAPAFA